MTPRGIAMLAVALSALFWAQPSGAFELAEIGPRAVVADVVGAGDAFDAITGGVCPSITTAGGSCTLTVTNKGTTDLTYTATITSNPNSIVSSYKFTSGSSASSGPVSTPTDIGLGSATTLTATLRACVSCQGNQYTVLWTLSGADAGVLDSHHTRVRMTVTYVGV